MSVSSSSPCFLVVPLETLWQVDCDGAMLAIFDRERLARTCNGPRIVRSIYRYPRITDYQPADTPHLASSPPYHSKRDRSHLKDVSDQRAASITPSDMSPTYHTLDTPIQPLLHSLVQLGILQSAMKRSRSYPFIPEHRCYLVALQHAQGWKNQIRVERRDCSLRRTIARARQ